MLRTLPVIETIDCINPVHKPMNGNKPKHRLKLKGSILWTDLILLIDPDSITQCRVQSTELVLRESRRIGKLVDKNLFCFLNYGTSNIDLLECSFVILRNWGKNSGTYTTL